VLSLNILGKPVLANEEEQPVHADAVGGES